MNVQEGLWPAIAQHVAAKKSALAVEKVAEDEQVGGAEERAEREEKGALA
jgi:hypothetical protein